ncbi:V-set domain-containing T-cell activation inhibitor 1-like isoform X2 [Seriola aureovittata]|uniref:V-set domain-containing T-cell activation inhibitor 1-like isoform X2 n=1 Tax=Seriola aureovittata TaxID=2871759 RepID=UPI0024BE340A|nr:V-set domain-containing T-cell activation inhibitor 1-like isoform X2 [Seriola aureovittata]
MGTTRSAVWTLLLIPIVGLTENFAMRSSHQPIRGTVGQAVILPCHVEPPSDVTDRTVDWKLGAKFVYVYRHNMHDPDHQHADFKNRTYVDKDEMRKGNLSLRIFPLKKTDAGNYTCSVPRQDGPVMRVNTELIQRTKCQTRPFLPVLALALALLALAWPLSP